MIKVLDVDDELAEPMDDDGEDYDSLHAMRMELSTQAVLEEIGLRLEDLPTINA